MGSVEAPYGSWVTPVNAEFLLSASVRLDAPAHDAGAVYWLEGRPEEGGRIVLVRSRDGGAPREVIPAPFSVRSRVHEYGGGAYLVHDGTVFFSDGSDNRLYRLKEGETARPITDNGDLRFADLQLDARRDRLMAVREDHRTANAEPVNTLVAVPISGVSDGAVLAARNDFYASPRVSPDGSRLAWLTWNHPNMPWDGTELWVADFENDGSLRSPALVAGGPSESIFGPVWSPDGVLHYVSDRTGWWNLYRWNGESEALTGLDAEFGSPQWVFGMSTYLFTDARTVVGRMTRNAIDQLYTLDLDSRELRMLDTPYTAISNLCLAGDAVLFLGGAPDTPPEVARYDLSTARTTSLRSSTTRRLDPTYLSVAEPIEFPTEHGQTAHAFFYPPTNGDYSAPAGERPPLLVISHGGPTGHTTAVLDPEIQFWTGKGFGLVDVNYGGSTGYGRAYRRRLEGQWGVVDVDDCVNAARYLARTGRVDGDRLIIRGGSSGGYTVLVALTRRNVFRAGASYYGIADLEVLLNDTHKFESRYDASLIGPPDTAHALYRERSPIHSIASVSGPVILFQGLDDRVVPPSQADVMVRALREHHLPFAYLAFEGEGHGFRRAATLKRAIEAELYFYGRVFGFPLGEPVEPVPIENLGETA